MSSQEIAFPTTRIRGIREEAAFPSLVDPRFSRIERAIVLVERFRRAFSSIAFDIEEHARTNPEKVEDLLMICRDQDFPFLEACRVCWKTCCGEKVLEGSIPHIVCEWAREDPEFVPLSYTPHDSRILAQLKSNLALDVLNALGSNGVEELSYSGEMGNRAIQDRIIDYRLRGTRIPNQHHQRFDAFPAYSLPRLHTPSRLEKCFAIMTMDSERVPRNIATFEARLEVAAYYQWEACGDVRGNPLDGPPNPRNVDIFEAEVFRLFIDAYRGEERASNVYDPVQLLVGQADSLRTSFVMKLLGFAEGQNYPFASSLVHEANLLQLYVLQYEYRQPELVKFLLTHGVRPDVKADRDDETALEAVNDFAKDCDKPDEDESPAEHEALLERVKVVRGLLKEHCATKRVRKKK